MLLVHHRLADLELGKIAQHALDRAALLRGATAPAHHAGIELGLGDDRPFLARHGEAVRQGRNAEHAAGRLLSEILEAGARLRLEPVLGEVVRHGLAPAGGLGGDQHAQLRALQKFLQRGERIVRAPVDRDRGQRLGGERTGLFVGLVVDIDARKGLHPHVELLGRHEELRRRQQRTVGIAAGELVARIGVAPEVLDRFADRVVQDHGRARRQVVEHRGELVEEERQVVLDPRGGHAVRHVAVKALLGRVAFEHLAPAAAEARAPDVVEREFARRQHADLFHARRACAACRRRRS